MYRKIFPAIFFCFVVLSCKQNPEASNTNTDEEIEITEIGQIIKFDESLDKIISPEARIELLAEGFQWSEGPLWVNQEGGYLLFSDIPPNSIMKWKEGEGTSLYLKPSGYTGSAERGGESGSNGLLMDEDSNLILCMHGDRRIGRMLAPLDMPKPEFETLVDNYNGMKLNSPNDAVYHSNGELYFTDPPYGLEGNVDDPAKEIPFQGVYRLDTLGKAHLLTDKITRPNGIAFSTDEKTLYVASSDFEQPIIMKYNVQADGSIDEGSLFFDSKYLLDGNNKGLPDGMKVHSSGLVFATGPGGVLVIDPDGKHLGTISTGEATANVVFDTDENYLYATSHMYLVRVKIN